MRIRRIDELENKTYLNAADKLRQLGHDDRSNNIKSYVIKKSLPEIKEDNEYIIDGGKYIYDKIDFNIEAGNRGLFKDVDSFIKASDDDKFIKFKFKIFIKFLKEGFNRTYMPKIFKIDIHVIRRLDDEGKVVQNNLIININPLSFDRKSALRVRRNILPTVFDSVPFSDVVSLLGLETELYSKVINEVENLSVNIINSTKNSSAFAGPYLAKTKAPAIIKGTKGSDDFTGTWHRNMSLADKRELYQRYGLTEELSPDTYREAGKKLLKMNHNDRGSKLLRYAAGEANKEYKYRIDGDDCKFNKVEFSINYQDMESDGSFDIDRCYQDYIEHDLTQIDVIIESHFNTASNGEANVATFKIKIGLNGSLDVRMNRYSGELFDNRASAILFKKEVIPTLFDTVLLSDFFILANLDVNLYKRIVDSIEGIGINNLYTDYQKDSDDLILLSEPARRGRYKKNESFNESISISDYKKWSKDFNWDNYKLLDSKFGKENRLYYDLKVNANSFKIVIPDEIEDFFKWYRYPIEDYEAGICIDKDGRRIRIGRLLNRLGET